MASRRNRWTIIAILVSAAAAGELHADVTAGDVKITPAARGSLRVIAKHDPAIVASAVLRAYDGKGKQDIKLTPAKSFGPAGDGNTISYTAQGLPLTVELELTPQGRCVVWRVTCRNAGKEQMWLELGPEIQVRSRDGITIFDGWEDVRNPAEFLPPKARKYPTGRVLFPVSCAWNSKAAVGIGLDAGELVSYFRHTYEPRGAGAGTLSCQVRIVADPGKEEQVRFIVAAAPGEWGKFEIFEAYYESFPSFFVPHPDVDPRLSLGDSMQNAWPQPTNTAPHANMQESCRRGYAGWSWCYAPFRRTGEILCRPELWDYKFFRAPVRHWALPRDEFVAWRDRSFANVKKAGLADLFYVDAVWCEEALVKERYSDSLITGPDASVLRGATAGCDVELNVFPLNTSFGRQYEQDTATIVKELDPAGFALDCAGNTWRYVGPALPTLPSRAWDETVGVYCGVEIGVAKYMDFVHTLKRADGSTVGMYPNVESGGPYAVFFRADATMLEGTPWHMERTHADRMRWKLGSKSLVWHATWRLDELFDESKITDPRKLKDIIHGLSDFTLLQSLRLGAIPNLWTTTGNPRLTSWLPAIVECVLTGWQPVPAARTKAPVWATRYGRGLDTLIAVAHETAEEVADRVTIQNTRIADGLLLMSHYDGSELANEIDKDLTVTPLTIPVRTPILLRAQLEALSHENLAAARVSQETRIAGATLKAVLDAQGKTVLRARTPRNMAPKAVAWNGKDTAFTLKDGAAEFAVEGSGQLEVAYISALFDINDADLLDYPFVLDNKPNCSIVLSPSAGETEKLMAHRLQEYFRYWFGHVKKHPSPTLIPITAAAQKPTGTCVHIGIDSKLARSRISLAGGDLHIKAPSGKALQAAMEDMLRALDTRYSDPGGLPNFEIFKRLGIAQTVLD
jgi:hypothetical protein